jgi:hypothetical protein
MRVGRHQGFATLSADSDPTPHSLPSMKPVDLVDVDLADADLADHATTRIMSSD